jgi:hypothetical protein
MKTGACAGCPHGMGMTSLSSGVPDTDVLDAKGLLKGLELLDLHYVTKIEAGGDMTLNWLKNNLLYHPNTLGFFMDIPVHINTNLGEGRCVFKSQKGIMAIILLPDNWDISTS